MKRARIIYNPTSGRELFKKNLPQVLQKFEQAGYETSCHATTCAGDATQATEKAAQRDFDLIVATGGDGTINEVVNGLAPLEKDQNWESFQLERPMTSQEHLAFQEKIF